jgi:hypothetical protein
LRAWPCLGLALGEPLLQLRVHRQAHNRASRPAAEKSMADSLASCKCEYIAGRETARRHCGRFGECRRGKGGNGPIRVFLKK